MNNSLKTIQYGFSSTPFGLFCLGMQGNKACYGRFLEREDEFMISFEIAYHWPHYAVKRKDKLIAPFINRIFSSPSLDFLPLSFATQGTPFQQRVWQELLTITAGTTLSYEALAIRVGAPKAVRAVANAVGANPIAYLIPCHRIIRKSGQLGGYRWGIEIKKELLKAEVKDQAILKWLD